MQLLLIGIAGAFGAISRYAMSLLFPFSGGFPLATFLVNLVGCFLFAFLSTSNKLSKSVRITITTGFFGAFTTFSAFSAETFTLLQQQAYITASSYVLLSLFGGLLCSYFGLKKGERIWAS